MNPKTRDGSAFNHVCGHPQSVFRLTFEYLVNGEWLRSEGSGRYVCEECLDAFKHPPRPCGVVTAWRWTVDVPG